GHAFKHDHGNGLRGLMPGGIRHNSRARHFQLAVPVILLADSMPAVAGRRGKFPWQKWHWSSGSICLSLVSTVFTLLHHWPAAMKSDRKNIPHVGSLVEYLSKRLSTGRQTGCS